MPEKMDLRRAKVRLLDLAHDLELADMPTEADALRCMARGPTFTERDQDVKEPGVSCLAVRMPGNFMWCAACGIEWWSGLDKGCLKGYPQPTTPNVPRNVPNHGPFTISTPYTKVYCNGESTD